MAKSSRLVSSLACHSFPVSDIIMKCFVFFSLNLMRIVSHFLQFPGLFWNWPFARPGHMVKNHTCWWSSYTVRLKKTMPGHLVFVSVLAGNYPLTKIRRLPFDDTKEKNNAGRLRQLLLEWRYTTQWDFQYTGMSGWTGKSSFMPRWHLSSERLKHWMHHSRVEHLIFASVLAGNYPLTKIRKLPFDVRWHQRKE